MWHKLGKWLGKETGKASHWWKHHGEGIKKVWRGAHHAAQTLDSWGVPLAGRVSKWMGKAEKYEKKGEGFIKRARNTRLGHARRLLSNRDVLRHTRKRHRNQSQIGLHPSPSQPVRKKRRPVPPIPRRKVPQIPTSRIGTALPPRY